MSPPLKKGGQGGFPHGEGGLGWEKRTLRGGGAGKPNGILVPLYEPIFKY